MVRKSWRTQRAALLLAVSFPAIAQYVATPGPDQQPAPRPGTRTEEPSISAKNGQTQEQLWADRYACHVWAKSQSGFDPAQQGGGVSPSGNASSGDQYRRSFTACLEGRGYSVSYGAPPPAAPTPPPASQPTPAPQYAPAAPAIRYHPLAVQIEGGYSVAAGTTDQYLEDGPNVGLGLTWFPISALPVGLRVDGSYSSFRAKDALLNLYGGGFTSGYEDIYGGDADLQFDLAHRSSRSKMYLFGGVGWYREHIHLRQVSFEQGVFCDFYYCYYGYGPVISGLYHSTSPWHSSWNSGLGWEYSYADGASFFIEARYVRIAPYNSKTQFVPIRVGFRF